MAEVIHYLGRTELECIAAGQTTICEGCKTLKFRRSLPEMHNRNPYYYAVDSYDDIQADA